MSSSVFMLRCYFVVGASRKPADNNTDTIDKSVSEGGSGGTWL